MNSSLLAQVQSADAQCQKRKLLQRLPDELFRALKEVESSVLLLPSAFVPGRLAVRPARSVKADQLIFFVDAHAGWFSTEEAAAEAGCDLDYSIYFREEFVRASLGGRVSARQILVAELARYVWPHLHFLRLNSACDPNCKIHEDFTRGAHHKSISVIATCDLEPFEQELFVRIAATPWAEPKKAARGRPGGGRREEAGAQAVINTGSEEAGAASGMKRKRRRRTSSAPSTTSRPSEEEEH